MCLLLLDDTSVGFADGWSCAADHACCDNCIQCIIQDSGSSICHTVFYEAYEEKSSLCLWKVFWMNLQTTDKLFFFFDL